MTREHFTALVEDALRDIPRRFRDAMANVAVVVEEEPSVALLTEMGVSPDDHLFGLYQGIPLPQRGWSYGNALPDRISIYQIPIEDACEDDDEIRDCVAETVIHEFGHYFGMSEEEIEEIEEKYLARRVPGRRVTHTPPALVRTRLSPRAKKHFGQHFLQPGWADRVVQAIDPRSTDRFLEIGPGPGVLTERLAPRVAHLTAVELDRDMVAALRPRLPSNVSLVEQDFLDLNLSQAAAARSFGSRVTCPTTSRPRSVQAVARAPGRRRSRRRDLDGPAGGRRPHRGKPGDEGLRHARDLRSASSHRPPRADAAPWRIPADPEGALGGPAAGFPRAGGHAEG